MRARRGRFSNSSAIAIGQRPWPSAIESREGRGTMDYPKLRPIEAFPVNLGGREVVCLRDPTQLTDGAVFVPRETLFILAHFDGKHSILDIQEAYTRQSGELLFS